MHSPSPSNSLLALPAPMVLPLFIGVRKLRVTVEKSANRAPHAREDEGEKEQTYDEEGDLRHDRNHHADHAQDEEGRRPGQVLRLVAPSLRVSSSAKPTDHLMFGSTISYVLLEGRPPAEASGELRGSIKRGGGEEMDLGQPPSICSARRSGLETL